MKRGRSRCNFYRLSVIGEVGFPRRKCGNMTHRRDTAPSYQRIVNKRGVFLHRGWVSAVCRLPSCGKDIACIRPGLIRSDRCSGVGGSDDGIRGEDVCFARIRVPSWCLFCLASGLGRSVPLLPRRGMPLMPGVSRGAATAYQPKPLSHSRHSSHSLLHVCDSVCFLLVVCISSNYRRSHIVNPLSILPSPTPLSLRGRLRHAKYPHLGRDPA